jgi:hypothetical protein
LNPLGTTIKVLNTGLVKTPETNRDVLTTELVKSLGPTTKVQITGFLNIPETDIHII